MEIRFWGAARTVTGSMHLLTIGGRQLLLECGLYQGKRSEAYDRNKHLPFNAASIEACILSHAHIDHSGVLPVLVKNGFEGCIYATSATRDLCAAMLLDSAHIQESDVRHVNKIRAQRGQPPFKPLYTQADAVAALTHFVSVEYHRKFEPIPGVQAEFRDSGHILGSAMVILEVAEGRRQRRVVFSGDLGRKRMPMLRDPETPPPCDVLIIESTYGDRLHTEVWESTKQTVQELVTHARAYRSKIIVPAFAVGRTQDLVMRIKELVKEGRIEPLPIYIDSPLATRATEVFRRHPECYDAETYKTFTSEGDPFAARFIHYVSSVKESMQLNTQTGPCMIIAASGMCEGGRILHHLKHAIQDEANIILIVGFQAEHTLGRKLVENWDVVPIFGIPTPRRAQVVRFNGLSAHADRNDLLAYVRAIHPLPGKVFVVHGEEKQALSLAAAMQAEHPGMQVVVPHAGSVHEV